ncbi:alpha/beta hydrolase [Nocardioides sp. W7]|uniref:alpha/beta hydrolase n=1 Tax=Nocardioides sp. W7 TaxID=2931390 RepID=UPI001FD3FAB8|nr:alpha/beta hydrolase [Nocardioides sp. W7]
MMSPRTVRVVVLVLVVVLCLGGLSAAVVGLASGGDSRSDLPVRANPPTPPPPGATDPPEPALASYYSQRLRWESCRDRFECSTLTVPLDYAEPAGETIDLALLRAPAGDPDGRVGSLVVNPGGPGAPGTDYAASGQFGKRLAAGFDIVGFDPRGTGQSSPVDCLSDTDLDAYLAADPSPDDPAEVDALVAATSGLQRGCSERSGELAGHLSTVEAARDLDVLRAALGEPGLLYLGASYGTFLGATYAELFPARVGRLVLDGAVDPSIDRRQQALAQAEGFETALRSYVTDCVDRGDCFLGDTVEAGLARIASFLEEVDAEPLPLDDGRELTEGLALLGVVQPLYVRDFWTLLDRGLETAFDGDGTVLALLADAYSSRSSDGTFLDNSTEANVSINCLDDPSSTPVEQVEAELPAFEQAAPTLATSFVWGLVGCVGFEPRAVEAPPTIRAEGAAPIVVVGTTRDPATPYSWALALAEQLESGVLVSRDGDGHTGYGSDNACVDAAVEDYLVDATVPADGLEC